MSNFEEQLKVFSAAQRLDSELKNSKNVLMDEFCLNINRQITHYYEGVKQKIMKEFESELDILIKQSKDQIKIDLDTNDFAFKFSGTLPRL